MSLPELKFRMGADPSGVKSGVDDAKKSVNGLDASMAAMATRAAKAGALIATGFASIKAAAIAAGVSAGKTAVEIDNLSRLANTSTTTFQKWAAGARSVGVEQDQLAGMLKDVTDRVGEFISTGGGPMSDFFENIAPKVGVTADQFARLSGPEALQLYVSSLEKAGVSQQQMTFYLEAFSGDLTKILPLLRNGGTEMQRLGDAAEAAGRIIGADMIRGGKELDTLFNDIADTLRTSATKAVLEHKDELLALARWIADTVIPALGDLYEKFKRAVDELQPVLEFWMKLARAIGAAAGIDTSAFEKPINTPAEYPGGEWTGQDGSDPSGSGTYPLDADGNVILDDGGPPLVTRDVITPPDKGGKSGKGGGGRNTAARDLDRMREEYATELELLDENLKEQLAKLEEFRAAKLAGEEELAALELKIREDHHEKMREVERAALQERLSAWSGAFGDLSALMSSENKKLFQIGKAAAVAQAVVDGWSAATTAWDKGMKIGGPKVAAAFAALSMARTGVMVAQIQATQIGGGGGGASAGGGADAAAAIPVQRVDIAYSGPAAALPSFEALVNTLNEASRRGYRVDARLLSA